MGWCLLLWERAELDRQLPAFSFLDLVDQILPYLFPTWSTHSDLRPRKEVENKKGEASDTLTFTRVLVVASLLCIGL